jgi:hypothetical protein
MARKKRFVVDLRKMKKGGRKPPRRAGNPYAEIDHPAKGIPHGRRPEANRQTGRMPTQRRSGG